MRSLFFIFIVICSGNKIWQQTGFTPDYPLWPLTPFAINIFAQVSSNLSFRMKKQANMPKKSFIWFDPKWPLTLCGSLVLWSVNQYFLWPCLKMTREKMREKWSLLVISFYPRFTPLNDLEQNYWVYPIITIHNWHICDGARRKGGLCASRIFKKQVKKDDIK